MHDMFNGHASYSLKLCLYMLKPAPPHLWRTFHFPQLYALLDIAWNIGAGLACCQRLRQR